MAQVHALGDLQTKPVDCRGSPLVEVRQRVVRQLLGMCKHLLSVLRWMDPLRLWAPAMDLFPAMGPRVQAPRPHVGHAPSMAGWGAQQRSATTVKHPVEGVMKGCSRVSKRAQSMG